MLKKRSKLGFLPTPVGRQSEIAPIISSPLFILRLGLSMAKVEYNRGVTLGILPL